MKISYKSPAALQLNEKTFTFSYELTFTCGIYMADALVRHCKETVANYFKDVSVDNIHSDVIASEIFTILQDKVEILSIAISLDMVSWIEFKQEDLQIEQPYNTAQQYSMPISTQNIQYNNSMEADATMQTDDYLERLIINNNRTIDNLEAMNQTINQERQTSQTANDAIWDKICNDLFGE